MQLLQEPFQSDTVGNELLLLGGKPMYLRHGQRKTRYKLGFEVFRSPVCIFVFCLCMIKWICIMRGHILLISFFCLINEIIYYHKKQNKKFQKQNPLRVMRKDRLVDLDLVSYVIIIVLLNCSKQKVTNDAFLYKKPA